MSNAPKVIKAINIGNNQYFFLSFKNLKNSIKKLMGTGKSYKIFNK